MTEVTSFLMAKTCVSPREKVPREKDKSPKRSMKKAYDDPASLKACRIVPHIY